MNVETTGFDRFAASLVTRGERAYTAIKQEALRTGQQIVADAKREVSVDTGGLRASIVAVSSESTSEIAGAYGMISGGSGGTARTFTIIVGPNKHYAAYVEYGTRPHCPPFSAILDWVIRKGIASTKTKSGRSSKARGAFLEQSRAAYLIMRKIQQRGTRPHPYMRPAVDARMAEFVQRVASIQNTVLGVGGGA